MKENDNLWPVDKKEKIVRALRELVASLESGSRGMLEDINEDAQCPDVSTWNSYILPSIPRSELNWMDAPWIVAEFYFYRRVVEAVQYYEITYDPFAVAKFDGLSSSLCAVERLCALYFGHLDGRGEDLSSAHYEIEFGVYCSLWGNKKDLSLWPAGRRAEG